MTSAPADVTLILEGTYPYVAGGVSSWVHQILCSCPDRRFALLHIGPHPTAYTTKLYELPPNVTELAEIHCQGAAGPKQRTTPSRKSGPRMLRAFRRLHLSDHVDDELIADLSSGDLEMNDLLHGDSTFGLVRELYAATSADAPFMDFFWHFRAMHIPLLRLLSAPVPKSAAYHAVSTGYAGVVGAVASHREKRPLVVTEHGLYARERELELARAAWIRDVGGDMGGTRPSPLRKLWSHYFRMLSKIAYHQATRLVTLSEANRKKQLADGADPRKAEIVPNGVDPSIGKPRSGDKVTRPLRVGFVGRVVPVKDVITLIRACAIAREEIDLEMWIVGPEKEDPTYAKRCHALVASLGLEDTIRFMGPQPVHDIYPQLDVLLLTSLSEGQPLVILEAYAAGLPIIATDVGACRELIEGGDAEDRALGPSGITTRVASPSDTAAALVRMARQPELRAAMGRAGSARLTARYQLSRVVDTYKAIYHNMVTS
jgi:polysaccharide biosynthesis protein PelF